MKNAGLRPEVINFAYAMERRLRANDLLKGNTGWKNDTPGALMQRVWEEVQKLQVALVVWPRDTAEYTASIGKEAADVANMTMMVADVCDAFYLDVGDDDERTVTAELAFSSALARFNAAVWTAAQAHERGAGHDINAGVAEARALMALHRGVITLIADQVDAMREALRLAEQAAAKYTRDEDCVEIDAVVTFLRAATEVA
ncbi:MAG: hypothetical protein ABI433_10005 [Burkholderiaceae bacterium]